MPWPTGMSPRRRPPAAIGGGPRWRRRATAGAPAVAAGRPPPPRGGRWKPRICARRGAVGGQRGQGGGASGGGGARLTTAHKPVRAEARGKEGRQRPDVERDGGKLPCTLAELERGRRRRPRVRLRWTRAVGTGGAVPEAASVRIWSAGAPVSLTLGTPDVRVEGQRQESCGQAAGAELEDSSQALQRRA